MIWLLDEYDATISFMTFVRQLINAMFHSFDGIE
jgi:hypothetical protein